VDFFSASFDWASTVGILNSFLILFRDRTWQRGDSSYVIRVTDGSSQEHTIRRKIRHLVAASAFRRASAYFQNACLKAGATI
jgi:hypothetical protein